MAHGPIVELKMKGFTVKTLQKEIAFSDNYHHSTVKPLR